MRFLPSALLKRFRRESVNDPFGGGDDDDFGVDSGFSLSGPKIALGLSALLFVVLIGGVAAVILTAEPPPESTPMQGSLAGLRMEEEPVAEPAAPPPESPSNVIAATDRSADRRPWLNPTEAGDAESAEQDLAALQSDTSSSGGSGMELAVEEISEESAETEITETEASAQTDIEVEETAEEERSLADAGPAPGAPGLFGIEGLQSEEDLSGARPRLVEPRTPPIDRRAVTAPPPRYANLANVANDAGNAEEESASKIAFVIEGLGLNQAATETAITKFPPAVTLAFSPYSRGLNRWLQMAKEHGHEVFIEVPMESKEFPAQDPGPLGLLTRLETEERDERLESILKVGSGAVGVLDTMGSRYRESDEHISALFEKLREENLYYVQGRPGIRVGESIVPTASAEVVIDERPFRAAIDARLEYAEQLAKYQGSVVAAIGAKPVGFERLVLWMEQAKDRGITLAPVSQILTQ